MHKHIKLVPAALFFLFLLWIISDADLDRENFLIRLGHAVPSGDKIAHFVLYGLMAWLLNAGLSFRQFTVAGRRVLLGSLVVSGFAIAEEFTQLAFASRTFDFWDMLCDLAGIGLIPRVLRHKKTSQPADY